MKTVVITLENYFRASIATQKYTQSLNCELKFLFILVIHHVFAEKLAFVIVVCAGVQSPALRKHSNT